jgi:hypothetical protein
MIPECRDCHRKRMDGVWQVLPGIQAAVMGWCSECMAAEIKRQRDEMDRFAARTARRQAHKESWDAEMVLPADPFQGFREG